ncbi:MAG: hypothetical protein JNJ83_04895 [Verrucomicrobiaceae bacterium]|nr:hypothetical protein [Verrucomicrobiaceae bacterium]
MSIFVTFPNPIAAPQMLFPPIDVAFNSGTFKRWREDVELETLVNEMIQFDPEYAEQLALNGMDRLGWA